MAQRNEDNLTDDGEATDTRGEEEELGFEEVGGRAEMTTFEQVPYNG